MTTINIKKHLYRLATCLFAATLFTCEKVPEYCRPSGEWYDPDYQFCFEGKARKQCSDGKYNPLTEGCDAQNLVGTMCADGSFVRRGSPCGGYTLSVGSAPASGGTVTSSHPGKTTFAAGDEVTLDAMPEEGYAFIGWAGAKNTADRAVTLPMNANVSLIAMFSPKSATGAATHTLVTAAFPEYGGTVSVNGATPANSGTTTHNAGTRPTVTAAPNPGYAFTGWSGASTSKSAAVTAAMDSSQTLVAIFTPNVYTLTVNSAPKEGGAVFLNGTAQTGTTDQYAETEIIALAKPAEGYSFAGWTGTAAETVGIDIEADSVKINLTGGNMTLTANFRKDGGTGPGPHPPSGSSSVAFNANGGSPTPATQTVTNGGKATKPANPTYEGYRFIGWYLNAEFT
ncbi:MAG: InlB B-repeat-containing protein, partial [Chitinispirillales bacterium]|nr:InlB B-repeat-containing protein [Chitinispirillales bacterium]